jgi:O-acetyl-ADP-ribose deacetylase (regulator of RNase III)
VQREYEVAGRKLQIHLGDITHLEVDALVNSENSDLIMDRAGGPSVSGAIRAMEGEGMAEALARLGPIEVGRAVVTPASVLPCKWVVHAASVVRSEEGGPQGHRTTLRWIREAVRSALQLASGLGLESIAFPAFGVRATEITAAGSSEAMVEELVAGLRQQTSLRRIVIALLDPSTFLTFFEHAMARATQANEPLDLRVTRQGGALGFAFQDAGPVAQVARADFAATQEAELRARLAPLLDHGGRRLLDLKAELRTLGGTLHRLLPGEVAERLAADPERPLRLQIDESLASLPFELACDPAGRFLAERPLDRRLVSSESARPLVAGQPRGRLEAFVLAGGLADLPSSAREGEAVLDLLWRRAVPRARVTHLACRRATRAAVLASVGRAEILHWCGHTERQGAGPAWRLADGELTPADVRAQPLAARLVFLNTCGRSAEGAMARAFLLAGARNVITTVWDVADEQAQRFALRCYEALCLGRTLGEALLEARRQLRAEGAIHWLAYQHYGDARERIFESQAP